MTKDCIDTDLALEKVVREEKISDIDGTTVHTEEKDGCTVTDIKINTKEAAASIGKPCGRYITVEIKEVDMIDEYDMANVFADELSKLMSGAELNTVLVAGLGNRHIPPDSLGARTADKINVTRVIADYVGMDNCIDVCAVSPGVLGVTGIETAEILKGICDKVNPDAVIVIDSLCARDIHRIACVIQMTDTGISPGGGLGNNRNAINSEVLGRKVIAIGVPTVVYAKTICHNVMEQLLRKQGDDSSADAVQSVMNDIEDDIVNTLVVTPKDIDSLADSMSAVIARGINIALKTDDFAEA